jgi:iron complex transport system ATP-binding protein
MRLTVEHVTWSVNNQRIIRDVSLEVAPGSFVGLIGPNGSGKSSLLRCIYRLLHPQAGHINLDTQDIWQLTAREMAQKTAVVLQETLTEFDFSVEEVVMMGRSPHKATFDRDTELDRTLVIDGLQRVGMADFCQRSFLTLSGGEKQRVLVARALAQQAQFLILDEPTNHLDIRYQLEVLELVKNLKITTFAALHDLNLAALYCDTLYVLKDGEVVAHGAPQQILTPTLINDVYGVASTVEVHPVTNRLHVMFFPQSLI